MTPARKKHPRKSEEDASWPPEAASWPPDKQAHWYARRRQALVDKVRLMGQGGSVLTRTQAGEVALVMEMDKWIVENLMATIHRVRPHLPADVVDELLPPEFMVVRGGGKPS